jgi:WD40 repeat protein
MIFFLKRLLTILFLSFTATGFCQPAAPIMRMETGMHTAAVKRISTDAAGKYLLTSGDDKTARLWDAMTGKLLRTFRIPIGSGNEGKTYACSLNPDGTIAAIGGHSGYEWEKVHSIYLVNTQTGEIIHRIKAIPHIVNDLEFSPDGNWLAAGLYGGNGVRLYDTKGWGETKKLEGYKREVYNIAFKPGGGLATVCYDGIIRLYDSQFELIKEKTVPVEQKPQSLAFNPSGTLLAIGYNDYTTAPEVWDAVDLSLLYRPSVAGAGHIFILSFSADGNKLYGGGQSNKTDQSGNAKYPVRCWNDAGKGSYSDAAGMRNTILDIKPLPGGSMAIAGYFPDIAVIHSSGKFSWHHVAGINDYSEADRSHLRINGSGSSIGFTPVRESAVSFDVLQRKLLEQPSLYPAATDANAGTVVTKWKNSFTPLINGKNISYLKSYENCRSTDISSNGNQIVLGGDYSLYLADNVGGKIWETALPGTAWAVNITGNDKAVAAALGDGTIRWYSMVDGKELIAFYLDADKKRWVLFTPSGYYDAAPGAEDLLGWHLNKGPGDAPDFFPVSRFREQFYRPDIIDAICETYNENEAISLANQRKGKKDFQVLTVPITQKTPPTISISNPANGSLVSSDQVNISYRITSPEGVPLKNIKVLVNGRPVATERGLQVINAGTEQKVSVNIPTEDCTVTLLVENDNGTSPEANLFLKWKARDQPVQTNTLKPNLYILSIGISEYANVQYKLGFAAKDARDFSAAILSQKGRLYNNVVIKTLTEKDASKVNILDGLQWIQENTTRKDVAMIFFAGHGVNDNNGVYYMLPAEADVGRLRSTCINFEEIKQTQSSIQGKVIVFIDACHSGNIMGAGGNYINGLINLLTSTVSGAGAITFTSSTGKEYSLEDPSWGNGAFTKALIEGLNGAASVDEEKEITYTSLSLYISRRVKKMTGDRQHPTLVPTPNTPDFPIAVTQ